jgi:hypothetical protein
MLQEGGVKIWRPRQVRPRDAQGKRLPLLIFSFTGLRWVRQARLCSHRGTSTRSGIESGTIACRSFWVRSPFDTHLLLDRRTEVLFFQYKQANRACRVHRKEQAIEDNHIACINHSIK